MKRKFNDIFMFRMNNKIRRMLEVMANERDRSQSWIIREAIELRFKDYASNPEFDHSLQPAGEVRED
jgi:predicted transcriptional regulator